ncbi:hypothetical protein GOC74_09055 [Halomicrobium mukohataei]|uniref:HIT-type domain-containing protein n=1 Tax=Halomicrobium mukohataei TaxID=57705 RepID=A0A847UC88_9EURY|nr:hypothetical protein [Halomicrobium mukohataei]NLV10076.1 hypothetical protein [Halomicrobium mukohataei]
MSVTGLCEICESATSEDACDLCGRQVCENHYAESDGICTACLGEAGSQPDRQPASEDLPDGVDTYEF